MAFLLNLWLALIIIVIVIFSSYTLIYYYYSRKPAQKFKEKFFPKVTLVIPFYNEEIIMKKKIENTSKINYPKNKLEVLFLNDHSNDQSVNIIKKEAKIIPFKFKIINNNGERGKPNALSYIFPKIKSEITIFTDADSLVKEDAIENLVQNFQDERVGGVSARISILKSKGDKTSKDEELYRFFFDMWRQGESNLSSTSVCNGPLMAFRTILLKDIHLTHKSGCSADDTELNFIIIKQGYKTIYDPSSIIYEVSPPKISERIKQKMRRIKGIQLIYLKNLNLLGKGKFGSIIYPYALLTHVIAPYLILAGCILYLILIFKIPYLSLLLLAFFIPKVGSFVFSFISTQIVMALSPIFSKGWNKTESSREAMVK